MLSRWIARARAVVLRRRLEREMQEEMAQHLDRATARLKTRGMSEREARRAAEREFGNVPWLQDQARDARGTAWLDAFVADLRYAVRQYGKRPATTATMFIVLALGMSLSTLVFSYVHSYATLPPPRIEREDDLVRVRGSRTAGGDYRVSRLLSEEEFEQYRALTNQFSAVAGWTDAPVVLDVGSDDVNRGLEARAVFVTDEFFPVVAVRPLLGPGLPPESHEADAPVAVINYRMWDQLFGRDPAALGRTVRINGHVVTIAGVAPARFNGIGGYAPYLIWLPTAARSALLEIPPTGFRAVARLRPGVSEAAAGAAVRVVAARVAGSAAEERALQPSAEVVPLLSSNGDPMFDRDVRLMVLTLGLLALIVLIVTCTNVSALLTGLATARRQEIAVRLSLGAARPRLIRQLLTESAVLACAAAAAAMAIVGLALNGISRYVPALPLDLAISWPAAVFTFGIALAVGVLFGLSPALHATRLAIGTALRDSSALIVAKRARLQRGLVITQIAFTQPLIVLLAAVLLIALSTQRRPQTDGLAEQLVTVSMSFSSSLMPADDELQQVRSTMDVVRQRVAALPGVRGALPHWRNPANLGEYAAHQAGESIALRLMYETVVPGYLELAGMPVVRGRDFTAEDAYASATAPDRMVIIGADYARRLWGSADPIGQRIRPHSDTTALPDLVVVGVINDPLAEVRNRREGYRVFVPPDTAGFSTALLVRTAATAQPLLGPIRQAVREAAPTMAARVRTLADREAENVRRFRIVTSAILTAGLLALLLSAIGLYAVIALSVGQRTREIAVRLAVGGRAQQIVRAFVADGLRLGLFGLALGLPASILGLYALTRIPDVPWVPLRPVVGMALLGVVCVTVAAAWIPARRAAHVEPASTLRSE